MHCKTLATAVHYLVALPWLISGFIGVFLHKFFQNEIKIRRKQLLDTTLF